jgi:hypothetical protein
MKKFLIFLSMFLLMLTAQLPAAAQITSVEDVCLTEAELKLADAINQFRKQNKLPEIPLSASLSFVAKAHIWDLQTNNPDTSICTSASWSNKGKWTPCCFNPYILKYDCMWDKPKELTSYTYRGYELVYYDESIVQPDSIFQVWKSSYETIDMLLTQNQHSDKKWLAMGLAIGENYVSLWFGQRNDPIGVPKKCSSLEASSFSAVKPNQDEGEEPPKTSTYYLIYGSFNTKADASEAIKRYKNSGLTNVRILEKEGRFRISLNQFDNLRDAMKAKEQLSISYPEIWIYKE